MGRDGTSERGNKREEKGIILTTVKSKTDQPIGEEDED